MPIQALDGVAFGSWPTRSAVPQADRFTGASQKLVEGCQKEAEALKGAPRAERGHGVGKALVGSTVAYEYAGRSWR